MKDKERCDMLIDEVRILKAENFALIERNNNQFKIITDLKARWEKLNQKVDENMFELDHYSKIPRNIEKMVKVSSMKRWMQELEKKAMK